MFPCSIGVDHRIGVRTELQISIIQVLGWSTETTKVYTEVESETVGRVQIDRGFITGHQIRILRLTRVTIGVGVPPPLHVYT